MVVLATTGYKLEQFSSSSQFWRKVTNLLNTAKEQGAVCILFPEYAGMEWVYLHQGQGFHQVVHAQETIKEYLQGFQTLAIEKDIYIASGTILVHEKDGTYRNRCYFFSPSGDYSYQDKIMLTPCESQEKFIQGGDEQRLFKTRFGTIGIAICYDSEFHDLTYPLTLGGADFILVPSYTDSWYGFHRVHIAARARAMESQCYTVHAVTLSKVENDPILDEKAVGYPGIFSPIDKEFPTDGILIMGNTKEQTKVYTTLCVPHKLKDIRQSGQVRNFKDQEKAQQLNLRIHHQSL